MTLLEAVFPSSTNGANIKEGGGINLPTGDGVSKADR